MSPPTVSVLISTLNRAAYLADALSALRQLRYPRVEVVVVNGPSTDHTLDVLRDYAGEIKVGACPEANLSMSRNIALSLAAGEIVALLDDDAIPEPDWLCRLVSAYADPAVGVAGGSVLHDDGITYQQHVVVTDWFTENRFFDSVEAASTAGALADGFLRPMGANASFKRQALIAVGGFDETFVYMADEVDATLRMIEAGWRVAHVEDAEVHHMTAAGPLRSKARIVTDFTAAARSKAYFCLRHGLKRHPMASALREISRWVKAQRQHCADLLFSGAIDYPAQRRLLDTLSGGIAEGIAAADRPPRLLQVQTGNKPSAFLPWRTLRPAAQRLRICFISADYPPAQVGGVARYTASQAQALAALGHEVSVLTRTGEAPRITREDGVWVHRVIDMQTSATLPACLPAVPVHLQGYLAMVRRAVLRAHLRRGFQVICSSIWNVEGLGCIGLPHLPAAVTLVTSYNLIAVDRPDWTTPEFHQDVLKPMVDAENWLLGHADLLIGSTASIVADISRANAVELPAERIAIVPFGLPDTEALAVPQPAIHRNEITLLFVGRFEPRKGIDVLLEALEILLPALPQLRADLVGDASVPFSEGKPFWPGFVARHADAPWFSRIHLHGTVDDAVLAEQYRSCDLFVAPSRYESFGLIYLEAMRAGKPVIGCTAGGSKEVVRHGKNGLLVPPGDAKALAGAIRRLATDDAGRAGMGLAGRADFLAHFTDAAMAHNLESVLKRVIA